MEQAYCLTLYQLMVVSLACHTSTIKDEILWFMTTWIDLWGISHAQKWQVLSFIHSIFKKLTVYKDGL